MTKFGVKKEIEKIIASLKAYKPEKIILFGSVAYGRLTKDSDLDLLIIKKTRKNPWERTLEADAYLDHDIAIDILVYTPQEIKKRLKMDDFFIREIMQKGKLIYAK